MGWFDDDDSDEEPSRPRQPLLQIPKTGPPRVATGKDDGPDTDADPLDAYMSGISSVASAQADSERRGKLESSASRDDVAEGGGGSGGVGNGGDGEEEVDPLDAFMSGLASGTGGGGENRKAERLDVENEEEATAHWESAATDGDGQAASKTSSRLLDSDGSGGGGGQRTKPSPPSSSYVLSASGSAAASALASTFHRAGEKKPSAAAAAATLGGVGGNDDGDDLDLDDLEAMIRKRQNKAVDPLDAVDHGGIVYESFRKAFLRPGFTERGEAWREENEVTCEPGGCDPVLKFEELGLRDARESGNGSIDGGGDGTDVFPPELLSAISAAKYDKPTPVQSQTLPLALSGRDCLVTASTGSGKTIAYVLPLVVHCCDQRHIEPGVDGPIGLVLTPTRELAKQVYVQCRKMLRSLDGHVVCVTGGEGKYEMTKELKKGCEVVVSTPGRLIDMVKAKGTNLRRITMIVLDEADKMLDMGFEKQVTSIMENVRPDRQTLMFSATFGRKVERVARKWLRDPVRISVGRTGTSSAHVSQHVMVLPSPEAKKQWLIEMLPTLADLGRMIVFVASRADCEAIARDIQNSPSVGGRGMRVDSIHGDRHQSDRNAALSALRKGNLAALVATDVAARGLDVRGVSTVVNFDAAKDLDAHVHRVGRAGRLSGGEYGKGTAYTLLTGRDANFANVLVESFQREGREVDGELMKLARRSRQYGGGGGGGSRWDKSGLGFHSDGPPAGCGGKRSAGGHSGDGTGGGHFYGPASGQRQGANQPVKRSRWG